jgi:RsiW-degrading membrane proteinase PrsW (M82 family)
MSQKASEMATRLGCGPLTIANVYSVLYVLLFGCVVLLLIAKTGAALLFPAYFLVAMLIVTIFNRTLPLRWVVFFFIYGATIVPFLTLVLVWLVKLVFGRESMFSGAVLVPILEETLKLLPLLIFLVPKWWRFRWTIGATDLMILGAAIGGGFTLHEDTLLGFIPGGVYGRTSAEFLLKTHAATPHLGPFYLFPSMDIGTANTAFIGHTAATAFIGLTIGLARLLTGRLGKVAWVLPLWAWTWVVFDHGLFNYVADVGRLPGLVKFIYTLDGYGKLSSVALYLLLLGALLLERWILWRYRERTKPYALSMDNLKLLKGKLDDPLESVGQAANLRVYVRERRGFTYGLHFYHSSGKDKSKTGQERLSYLQQVAGALAEWKNGLEVTPSLSLAES